jgi:hypothetical protein
MNVWLTKYSLGRRVVIASAARQSRSNVFLDYHAVSAKVLVMMIALDHHASLMMTDSMGFFQKHS